MRRFSGEDQPSKVEHLSPHDDAWYGVDLFLVSDVLWLRYDGFTSEYDELFPSASENFSSSDEIKRFGARFRPVSVQMQDSQCGTVSEGTIVCAAYRFDSGDLKYYDATVVKVQKANHSCEDGQKEVCRCTYWLSWRHGPLVCKVTPAKIGDICLRPGRMKLDPTLIWFLRKANEKLILQRARNVPISYGTRGSPMRRLSSPSPVPTQRTIAHGPVAQQSAGDNVPRTLPLHSAMQRDLITSAHGQGSMIQGTSGKSTLCYPHESSSNSEASLPKKKVVLHERSTLPLPRLKLSSTGARVIREENNAPPAVLGQAAGEKVTHTNEPDAAAHQQQPPYNNLDFYSRRRKKCAKWTDEGKLCGKCKKQ